MDDLHCPHCPHCQTGVLIGGICRECGWSLSSAVPISRRTLLPPPPSASPSCWVALPFLAVLVNLFLPLVCRSAESIYPVTFTMGVVAAQFGLLAIVGALGSDRHVVRLPVTFAIAAVLLAALLTGVAMASENAGAPQELRAIGGAFLLLPALLLSAQSPLWIFRGVSGRRLAEPALRDPSGRQVKTQFGIGQMMLATALIAVSLGLARGSIVLWSRREADLEGGWAFVAIACGGVAVASAVVTLPCAAAVLIARQPGPWIGAVLAYGVLLTSFLVMLVAGVAGGAPPAEVVIAFGLFSLTTFGAILTALAIIRKSGYALVHH